jgi:nucleoside phosphorylase
MIAVTFALPAESSEFLRRLHKKSKTNRNGITVIRGEVDGDAIEVLHTGVGEKVCRERMGKFLQDRQFGCLISAGFAGALNDQLHVGDVLVAENFSTVRLSEVGSFFPGLPAHIADLLTVPSMIESREERDRIAQTTGAVAADMETEFIARACAEHAIPLLSLRVISDTPSKPFPAPANVLFNMERQRADLTKLTLHFLRHPGAIPRLIAFARKIAQAREILANAIVGVVGAIQ